MRDDSGDSKDLLLETFGLSPDALKKLTRQVAVAQGLQISFGEGSNPTINVHIHGMQIPTPTLRVSTSDSSSHNLSVVGDGTTVQVGHDNVSMVDNAGRVEQADASKALLSLCRY